jgi:hypothetical protein
VAAPGEVRLDPLLEGRQVKLLEPADRGLHEGLVGEVGQRGASPERERLPEPVCVVCLDEALEVLQIVHTASGL